MRFGGAEEYGRGHIPGACFLDTNTFESSTDWNRRTPEELETALFNLGIHQDTTVILYGRDTAADPHEQKPGRTAGQIAATRAAAILLYAGVRDVRVLDGGYNAWVAAGFAVETEPRLPGPGQSFGADIPDRPEFFIDLDEARQFLTDPNSVLVSIRSWAEHIGETSGYDYIGDTGDIPGAVWGNCGANAYDMQYYRNVDRQHDAGLQRDRFPLGRGRDNARKERSVLLRHRLAGERGILLRLSDGLAPGGGLRRRLVRMVSSTGLRDCRLLRRRRSSRRPS